MSYEKLRVMRVDKRVDRETGEITHFVEFQRVVTVRLNCKTAAQVDNLSHYHRSIGKEVLVQIREGVMEGRHWVAFDGDGIPISMPDSSQVRADTLGFDADVAPPPLPVVEDKPASPLGLFKKTG